MSKGFYDFDSDAEHWTEMFEQAQNLGFNPLLPADNFPPRIFGLSFPVLGEVVGVS